MNIERPIMKISYQELNVNGYTIRGLLSTPDDGFKQIAVCLHGYTGHKNENGFLFKQITKVLVEHNMATLRFDYMGSGDSDGEFSDQTFETVKADARSIIKEAVRLNHGKPIYLIGFSMGGANAARMSAEMPELIEKLVLLSPAGKLINNLTRAFTTHEIVDDKYVDLGGYYLSKDFLTSLQDCNLYAGVENFTNPVLILQGTKDQAVNPADSKLYDDLYPNSKYILIEGAEHCYTKVPYRKQVQTEIIQFLCK